MFSPLQISEILEILNKQNLIFISSKLGVNYLSPDEVSKLQQYGINPYHLYKDSNDIAKMSFHFGLISDAIGKIEAKDITLDDLKDYFIKGDYIPLTKVERNTIDSIKKQYLGDIRANNSRIFQDVNNIIAKGEKNNREAYEKVIRDEVEKGALMKKTSSEIAIDLARKTGDWNRNFRRIVSYISHQAWDEGRAASISDKYGDDALVAKNVYSGACLHCIRLYLTAGIGSKPKIFKLSELKYNGSNIGRKNSEMKPVIGSTHPHSLTDGKTSILTENGWKMIKDIQIGEKVLTHKGRFRPVVSKINGFKPKSRDGYKDNRIFQIEYYLNGRGGNKKQVLSLTSEHKILTQRGWVEVQFISLKDKIKKILRPCSNINCNKYVDFFTKNGRVSCSEKCHKEITKKNIIDLYSHSEEKSLKIREKIGEGVSKRWKEGGYEDVVRFVQSPKNRKRQSDLMLKDGRALKIAKIASGNFTSKIQIKLFNKVIKLYSDAELEYEFLNKSLDIAIPSLKINIEYDGSFWHNKAGRPEKDLKRDNLLRENGWSVIRYKDILPSYNKIKEDINVIMNNHNKKYKFEFIKISKIVLRKIDYGYTKLYDIGVEEDESFVARGIVIHNCRCTLFSVDERYDWDEKKQSFSIPKSKEILEPKPFKKERKPIRVSISGREYIV